MGTRKYLCVSMLDASPLCTAQRGSREELVRRYGTNEAVKHGARVGASPSSKKQWRYYEEVTRVIAL